MKKIISILSITAVLGATGCMSDSEWLNQPPTSIISPEQAFANPANALSVLANLYNRQLDISGLDNGWASFADFSESFPSENGSNFFVQRNEWGFGEWGNWDYGYIRELNLFLQRAGASTALAAGDKARFIAEGRFLRANFYFELTKRLGGVPLITEPLLYDFSGDPTYLQHPRAKESEMYDFVISEMDAIKADLPKDANTKGRATYAAAMAIKARAALYAGSIAKYGVNTPEVTLPGGEVGIPAAMANDYYGKALAAAQEIITGTTGAYGLYKRNPNLSENFANMFLDKANNPEAIWVEDFKLKSGRVHAYTVSNQPRYGAEEEEGGRLNPSLNLVEAFEKLDNTFAPIPNKTADGSDYIYYTNQLDIFAGRDARLAGTVILPGSSFKGRPVDIWAGYILADGSIVTGDDRGQQKTLPGTTTPVQVVGFDGPINNKEFTAQSGFYIRKYLDPATGAGSRGTNSEVPFMRYRYAEVLLNAAEAAFELNQKDVAVGYINQVRERAGLVTPLTAAQLTFDRIVHERRVELAFEGHILYDMKRWRLAHVRWDGASVDEADLLANIGKATKHSTQPWALWPYKIYNPASPNNGKWVFKILKPAQVTGSNRFRLGNYYSFINDDIRNNNPKIVRQPNQ